MTTEDARERRFLEAIRAEQIVILFRAMPVAQASNLLVASALAWFLWRIAPHGVVLGWWAAIVFIVLVRLALAIAFSRRRADARVAWHMLMTAATIFSGLVWGAAGVLFFFPDSGVALVVVCVVLAAMSAGSIASHSSWPPAQLSYVVLTLMPITLRFLVDEGDLRILGPMCLLYLYNLLAFSLQLSRTLKDSIRTRLEKQDLVKELREEMSAAEEARARAEDANLAKSKFLAAASHDLRQPLHAMNLFIEALRHEKDPARAETTLTHLGASAQSVEELLNELLDISRLEAGLFKPQFRVLFLQEVFDALELELRPVAEEKGVELGFVATRARIVSDPNMLGRILRNIITNAIRYTERGAVLVGCRRKVGRIAIAVYDTGPGIAPEHRQAIFREFYQLGNPERDRRKGLGLGLAIVDGLCRVLDHPLELKSSVGRGSTFLVHVSVAAAGEPCGEQVEKEDAFDLHGYAILVIDDDATICRAMTEVLGSWGCKVLTAESTQDALARIAAGFTPDVIVADYRLRQGHTGTEAIARIRHTVGHPLPAAILTGDTAPERLREASASGSLLLHKPVNPASLRTVLVNCCKEACADHASSSDGHLPVDARPAARGFSGLHPGSRC